MRYPWYAMFDISSSSTLSLCGDNYLIFLFMSEPPAKKNSEQNSMDYWHHQTSPKSPEANGQRQQCLQIYSHDAICTGVAHNVRNAPLYWQRGTFWGYGLSTNYNFHIFSINIRTFNLRCAAKKSSQLMGRGHTLAFSPWVLKGPCRTIDIMASCWSSNLMQFYQDRICLTENVGNIAVG